MTGSTWKTAYGRWIGASFLVIGGFGCQQGQGNFVFPQQQQDNSGAVLASLDEAALQAHVDTSKKVSFQLTYLDKKKDADLNFVNGKAEVVFEKLPVGQTGTLTMKVSQDGQTKLSGTVADLVLTSGANRVKLVLLPVGQGGETSDLELDVTIANESGEEEEEEEGGNSSPGTGSPPGTSQVVTFATDIKPLAERFCSRCHSESLDEPFWTGQRQELVRRISPGAGGDEMPRANSPERRAFSVEARDLMLKYLSQG